MYLYIYTWWIASSKSCTLWACRYSPPCGHECRITSDTIVVHFWTTVCVCGLLVLSSWLLILSEPTLRKQNGYVRFLTSLEETGVEPR